MPLYCYMDVLLYCATDINMLPRYGCTEISLHCSTGVMFHGYVARLLCSCDGTLLWWLWCCTGRSSFVYVVMLILLKSHIAIQVNFARLQTCSNVILLFCCIVKLLHRHIYAVVLAVPPCVILLLVLSGAAIPSVCHCCRDLFAMPCRCDVHGHCYYCYFDSVLDRRPWQTVRMLQWRWQQLLRTSGIVWFDL